MFCYRCGQELPDSAVFCNKCGIKVYKGEENEQSASASQAETSPSPLISKAVNIQNEMKKEQPETAYPQPSNVENHAINCQSSETARLQSVVPTTAVSSQQEAARKKASSGHTLALATIFVSVAIIVACVFRNMINEKNRQESYTDNGFTTNDLNDSVNVTGDSEPSDLPSKEKEEAIGEADAYINGDYYDIQSTRALRVEYARLSDRDIKNICRLVNLQELSLKSCEISDWAFLSNLTYLTSLSLISNDISDITLLENLTNLTSLSLRLNKISDIAPLINLTNLTELDLSYNKISDFTLLENLTNLKSLDLYCSNISDATQFANMTNLTKLELGVNNISDVTPLANLTNLTELDLYWNEVSDITPLANLTNLTELSLNNNKVSRQDMEWFKSILPNCRINY